MTLKSFLSPTRIILLVILSTALLALPGYLHAQEPPTLEQINAVAKELYCPLCNGVRLDTCELQACEQMRQVIGEKLTEGVPKQQIKDEFVAQYGPVVLGEPPREGLNLLGGWVLPIALFLVAAAAVTLMVLRWSRRPEPAVAVAAPTTQAEKVAGDEYLARVEADLADLE
ncbi:MAG: cytochrome c-type biogenesis protein CcmH [Anaerolineae bacterium]|nr:cytochrome c-type biogenesis protein CcmH [Anaerolineae bacterium]MCB9131413.1 cytochrome c-type biogenesis protein CcmH [Anaerolineales bacterium]MCB0230623.1 cytochrome c-type biogenesis protein CcmH [Anaerolineae bacterium]MCB0232658.1 cytochrome c-type biogenesis protein CcmH [Anaerolineae bacterium]MCB0238339.1 cytochrome c-type biogenesis protein CcmH [Anaerolineae bacterium]